MKTIITAGAFILFSATQASALSFRCFSRSYTFNQSSIQVAADVVSNRELAHVHVVSEDYGIGFDLNSDQAAAPHSPYAGFNIYPLGANPSGRDFEPLAMLLPTNLETLRGKFNAYVTDANALRSRPVNFNRVACETR
jgi:hypothetical protein